MRRRKAIKSTIQSLASLYSLQAFGREEMEQNDEKTKGLRESSIPEVGTIFNEAIPLQDKCTGRKLIQLTTARDFNQKPTYHIKSGFSADSRYIPIVTWNNDQSSALMRADINTGELLVLDKTHTNSIFNFVKAGNDVSIIPAASKIVAGLSGRQVKVYDLSGKKAEVLIDDIGEGKILGHPIGSADGNYVYIPSMVALPDDYQKLTDFSPYTEVTYLRADVKTGKIEILLTDKGCRNNHVIPNPRNTDLLLLDRDLPPGFGRGGDGGKNTRCWIYNIKSGKFIEIRPKAKNRFQVHGNWNYNGTHVYYHGLAEMPEDRKQKSFNGNLHYIGVADLDGNVVWEKTFPYSYYGHVSSHETENCIILDGLITNDLITGIRWDKRDSCGEPEILLYGTHRSDWKPIGQHAHPHCQVSPDGKWLTYNRSYENRSDVFALRIR
jgi:hypothetical protein